MERLNVPQVEYPVTDARCTEFVSKDRKQLNIVTLRENLDGESGVGIAMLLVHEAVHVWQHACDMMGEKVPSIEFEAYTIQAISLNLIDAYEKTRRKLFR